MALILRNAPLSAMLHSRLQVEKAALVVLNEEELMNISCDSADDADMDDSVIESEERYVSLCCSAPSFCAYCC